MYANLSRLMDVTYRDFCALNLMMDASRLIPGGFHFSAPWSPPNAATHGLKYHDRSKVAPMKYYLIDFGLCSMLPDKHSRVTGVYGQDKTVPELSWDTPYDPFKVDIYQFGNVLRETLIDVRRHRARSLSRMLTRLL